MTISLVQFLFSTAYRLTVLKNQTQLPLQPLFREENSNNLLALFLKKKVVYFMS